MSAVKALESFEHIDLTEEEKAEGILWAKRKKEALLEEQTRKRREEENRRFLTQTIWSYNQVDAFMRSRASALFNGKFDFSGQVSKYYQLLCCYFSKDPGFFVLAVELGVDNPSFDKGIYLGGNFGVGKTWLMQLFQRNQRQVFGVYNAKKIANDFERDGDETIGKHVELPELPINDFQNFLHRNIGLCIDDMGTEEVKSYYGNKKNVIGSIIELRYDKGNIGTFMHVTTNLTGEQLTGFYGERIASRLRKCVNIIDFIGEDLRK